MEYISYFSFLGTMKQWIHDAEVDFKFEKLSGEDFDTRYKTLLKKLEGRCASYSESYSLMKQRSKFISAYIKDMKDTMTFPQADRFAKLLDVTESYIRMSV